MIRDVTEATFQQDVVDRSHDVPVVVDFWAAWCGPCRQLTPVLEDEVRKREPNLDLAKLDTDANQQIAAAFRIQGIPAVKAFKDGKVVDEFVGAQPPPQVRQFLDGLLPSEADGLVEAGDEASLRRALELEPTRADASVALARLLRERGEKDAALEVLSQRHGLLRRRGPRRADPARGRSRAAGRVRRARRRRQGRRARRADRRDRRDDDQDRRDELRRAVVGILDGLGAEHPLARESRRKLAAALY